MDFINLEVRLFNGGLRRKELSLRLLENNARSFVQYLRRRKDAAKMYAEFIARKFPETKEIKGL